VPKLKFSVSLLKKLDLRKTKLFCDRSSSFCSTYPNMCDRTKRIGYRVSRELFSADLFLLCFGAKKTWKTNNCFCFSAIYVIPAVVLLGSRDFTSYAQVLTTLPMSSAIIFGVKSMIAFPFIYHILAGVRHLVSSSEIALPENISHVWDFKHLPI
jgi:hypothetical protein